MLGILFGTDLVKPQQEVFATLTGKAWFVAARSCIRKKQYLYKEAAEQDAWGDVKTTYKCQFCEGWHNASHVDGESRGARRFRKYLGELQ